MKFKTRQVIKELEENINNSYSLPIFKGYKAVNKYGVEKLIDELYAYLPDDVRRAREFLKNRNYNLEDSNKKEVSNIYDLLKGLESYIERATFLSPFFIPHIVFLNVKEIEELLNRIQNDIPTEIQKAENLDK